MEKFKIVFEVEIDISDAEIDHTRRENRSFLTHGFFAKNLNVAKIIAYNRAIEKITKGDAIHYDIVPLDKTNI
jgi:hypothetical protein